MLSTSHVQNNLCFGCVVFSWMNGVQDIQLPGPFVSLVYVLFFLVQCKSLKHKIHSVLPRLCLVVVRML